MTNRKLLYYKLRVLFTITAIWLVAAFVFYLNITGVRDTIISRSSLFYFAVTFWLVGLTISGVLVFYLKDAFKKLSVLESVLLRLVITFLLFVALSICLSALYYYLIDREGSDSFLSFFIHHILFTSVFSILLVDMGLMTLLSIVLLEVTDKYGPGMFRTIMYGGYLKPKEESRIFIFLDINSSTTIAEQLGHTRYFAMLQQFFADITIPVLVNDGDIYQYVGDEVIISWPNTPENKIKSLKFIRNAAVLLQRRSRLYGQTFGLVPHFKAGVHAGLVTAGLIGVIKKDLIYSGDTLNTTARIRSSCNELNESYILSEDFMLDFHQPYGTKITAIGSIELKGRQEPVMLYALAFE